MSDLSIIAVVGLVVLAIVAVTIAAIVFGRGFSLNATREMLEIGVAEAKQGAKRAA